MSLSIANPTMQDWTFPYRIGAPGSPQFGNLRQLILRRGARVELHLDRIETAQMIKQLEANGARDASEVRGTLHRLSGLLYSEVRDVAIEEIEAAHEIETQTREDRAVSQAVKAGLGFDRAVRRGTRERPGAMITEVEVKEEHAPGKRARGTEVAFDLTVSPDGGDDRRVRRALAS